MDSTPMKTPEAMSPAQLLAELETSARERGDERALCLLQALADKVMSHSGSSPTEVPLGWKPYGDGPRDLNSVKE